MMSSLSSLAVTLNSNSPFFSFFSLIHSWSSFHVRPFRDVIYPPGSGSSFLFAPSAKPVVIAEFSIESSVFSGDSVCPPKYLTFLGTEPYTLRYVINRECVII